MDKTSSGLDQNIAAALTYALGWITAAIFLLTEPTNKFVRFHALQSLIVFGGLSIIWLVAASSIPIIGLLIALVILPPLSVFLWLLLMFKAYQGVRFKLPFAGEIADQREH